MLNLFCTYSTSSIYLRPLVPLLFGLEFTVLSRCLSFICIWLKQMCLQKCCKSVQKSKRKTYVGLILHIFYFVYSLTTINNFTLRSGINVPPNRLFFFFEKTPSPVAFWFFIFFWEKTEVDFEIEKPNVGQYWGIGNGTASFSASGIEKDPF